MKRRQFTQTLALLAGGAVVPAFAGMPSALNLLRADVARSGLSRDFFEARVGKQFLMDQSGTRSLLLKKVEDACGESAREQFFAFFEAAPGTVLKEGIYRLERPQAGRFNVYLTESDRGQSRPQFVTIINLQTVA